MSRHATVTAVLFAAVIGAFVLLASVLLPAAPAQAVQERPAAPVQVQAPAAAPTAPDAFLVRLVGPGAELPENAEELLLAADRVCEGITAGVPASVMTDTLAAEPLSGMDAPLTQEEAAHLVQTAAATHCAADAR